MDEKAIFELQRPDPSLLKLYVIRSLLTGPFFPIVILPFYFRYRTLRYRFDDEGIHMRWGILFRREINLTYARIQDIHLRSGIIQRWLGLANLMVQTASGSAGPEMTIEGFREFEAIQNFLYTRMRGYRHSDSSDDAVATESASEIGAPELSEVLLEIRDELRGTREALEQIRKRE